MSTKKGLITSILEVLWANNQIDHAKLNTHIAVVLGWSEPIFQSLDQQWVGTNPSGVKEVIPSYLQSVDASLLVIPEKWVESYLRRFDDCYSIECHPRGDLFLKPIREISRELPVGMVIVGLGARLAMLHKEDESNE